MRPDLPSGRVTFLFTDIEGSTRLLHELGAEAFAEALAEHRRILRQAFTAQGGVEVDTQGDAFFVAFPTEQGAIAAAAAARDALAAGPIRVRMGIHTGTPHLGAEGYIGADVHRGARIGAAGHGGQVLVSAATAALIGTDGLLDLGEHRLKDFDQPTPIYQLGDERFPPLKTISNTNLPRPASTFVGRESEVAAVAALLQDGARLVTLTGPGGSGKTRLGIEAAATLVPDFKAGVFWVGLAALRDPALVSETIGQTIGAKEGLAEHIGERQLLLLLDNLEQVMAAAPELATLVEACPHLRLLVTSRERLRVRGEVEYPVLPLADAEAVALFGVRAGLEADDTIHTLCRALDNLPLAIELAAARVSVLTPAQILERLSQRLDLLKGGRDADPRQQTLRATIEWSHELLTADEQRLFARLAVFAGGCTLEAAEQLVAAELDVIQSLVDKSLLRFSEGRFWMLETIREYATQRLEASGQATELRHRHADFFLALAEEAEPHLLGPDRDQRVERLAGEHDNLRAALAWFEASAEGEEALRLAGALDEFWCAREHWPEGRRYLERLLDGVAHASAHVRAKALIGAAHLARDSGDAAGATQRARAGLEMYEVVGDPRQTAKGLYYLGAGEADQRNFEAARERFEQSAALSDELGDEPSVLFANRMLAWVYSELGDRARAVALHQVQLDRARALGMRDLESSILGALAQYTVDEGRVNDAAPMAAESIRIALDLGDPHGVATEICRGAAVLARAGQSQMAAELIASAVAFHDDAGIGMLPYLANENQETLSEIHSQLARAAFDAAWERGRKRSVEDAAGLAVEALARVTAKGL